MTGPDSLERFAQLAGEQSGKRNFDRPPLHLWHPELSGDIPIRIDAQGNWYHDGGLIKRESLVKLFASILRREEDGAYYLVTPVEKWRIEVELHALVVIDVTPVDSDDNALLRATLNTGQQLEIGAEHTLFLEESVGGVAAITLWHGLSALFNRAAWLRLVDAAQESDEGLWVTSGSERYFLGATES